MTGIANIPDNLTEFLRDASVNAVRLPPQSPNLNPYAERFVRSIKDDVLNHLIIMSERSLRYVIKEYISHYHTERNHQGLGNQLIEPRNLPDISDLPIVRSDRIGGLLSFYER